MNLIAEHKLVNISNLKFHISKEPFYEFKVFTKGPNQKFVYITDFANGIDYEYVSNDIEYVIGSICEQSQISIDDETIFFVEETCNNNSYLILPTINLDS
ncbi:hypothetical protein HWA77_17035 [Photobacterium damselae subsp. damselae]|uniref:Uncharacterized protein n=1 Tax=Photobacterium damselae subsp. damselae TaxID=85581 RepID=A0A850QTV7_PHODD|nr:hypothetical protein [Photobacterium damselae subsp. damselae]